MALDVISFALFASGFGTVLRESQHALEWRFRVGSGMGLRGLGYFVLGVKVLWLREASFSAKIVDNRLWRIAFEPCHHGSHHLGEPLEFVL